MTRFAHILVPVDYSESSDAALRLAGDLARAFRGRLAVLHALPTQVYAVGDYPVATNPFPKLDEETRRLRAHVKKILGDRDTPPFDVEVTWGSPYLDIIEQATDRHVDLIVMGTHGRTGLKHLLLGSVAERTVRLAPCAVLTTRGDSRELPRTTAHTERSSMTASSDF